jgi:hypothetical protein
MALRCHRDTRQQYVTSLPLAHRSLAIHRQRPLVGTHAPFDWGASTRY